MSKEVFKDINSKKGETMIKLHFSSQNVYNFQKNINAKAAQVKPIAREPYETQNKNTIEAKHNYYSNIIMNEIQSGKYQDEEIQYYQSEENNNKCNRESTC